MDRDYYSQAVYSPSPHFYYFQPSFEVAPSSTRSCSLEPIDQYYRNDFFDQSSEECDKFIELQPQERSQCSAKNDIDEDDQEGN